jgi:hypothetical protein
MMLNSTASIVLVLLLGPWIRLHASGSVLPSSVGTGITTVPAGCDNDRDLRKV